MEVNSLLSDARAFVFLERLDRGMVGVFHETNIP